VSTSLVMRAILAAAVLSAAPAIANAQAPQTKPAKSTAHKQSKAWVHRAKVDHRAAHAGKKAKKVKKRASSSRLPVPEHPNGHARW
jgi:Ni/Co efflux regulator RcnB